jgi:tetratricopeptide (TPR) repeat protein
MLFGLFGCTKNNNKTSSEKRQSLLLETINQHPQCVIYEITNSASDNPLNWSIKPTDLKLIPNNENHYLVKAQIIDSEKNIETGFINLSTPERISDYVIHNLDAPKFNRPYELKDKDVIPAVASDCFGVYELYYSKISPNSGIKTLKEGLELSQQKSVIAEDIAYILRDENRLDEALKYFLISTENEPSSEYIYGEIANIYRAQGNEAKANEYKTKFENY